MNLRILTIVSIAFVGACGNAPDEPTPSGGTAPPAALARALNGYSHELAHSRLAVGGPVRAVVEHGFDKQVGPFGTFAVVPETGFTIGLLNADAPARMRPALTDHGEAHDRHVRAYFVSAGLPADEIASVNAHATMQLHGSAEELRDPAIATTMKPEFERYTSVLSRAMDSVTVVDSFAWASFNADGEVTAESVFWPAMPDEIVREASTWRGRMTRPDEAQAYRASLPAGLPEGQVVIRHGAGTDTKGLDPVVVYDVLDPAPMRGLRHFDRRGTEVFLARENAVPGPETLHK